MNEREVFDAALAIADPSERCCYLDRVCGDDQPLRDHLRGLLEAHDKLGGFLQRPLAVGDGTAAPCPTTKVGAVIASRYKLLEQIGEGGMGTVWVAEQTEPVKRRVALKLIKPGMDTRQVLSRFEAERQALALMDHPKVARVFDGGMTDEGRPFFVMEYVKGLPLTQYCDDTRLTVAERLALFTQVCQAVQHAHQKGIIHRDLKPSNILVCLYDGHPVPKVIDFGLAKAMHQSLTEHTLYTAHGLMVGTPLYMSPEQAEFNNLDIDTRSDIYSLGVILYELLTGTTPLEKRQFKDAAWQEMLRLIKEEEPPRPSTRLSASGSLPTLAAQRSLDPAKLTKTVRGELDWIVMNCLEKDRGRRYETANGLARDVERYLADDPVQACPPSTGYRLRKFARRNKRALVTGAVVAVLLLVTLGAVSGSIGWLVRDQEAPRTKLASHLELILDEVKQHETEQKWPEALAAARRAEALLTGGGGDEELSRQVQNVLADLNLVQRLETIRMEQAKLEGNRPEWADRAYAAAFREIGVDPDGMTADEAAKRLLARKEVAPALAVALDEWGVWRYLSGKFAGARAIAAVAERLDEDPWRRHMRRILAEIDAEDLESAYVRTGNLGPQTADALQRLADSPDVAGQPPALIYHLGMALGQGTGKRELGTAVLLKGYRRHSGDFWINAGLADNLANMGPDHQDEALGYYRATLALRPDVGWSWYRIGSIYQFHHKNLDEANACYQKAVELDPNDPWTHNGVAWNLWQQNKPDEAIAHYRKTIELNPKIGAAHSNLGNILRQQKKLDESIASHRKAIEVNPKRAYSQHGLGLALLDQHLTVQDDKILEEAITNLRKATELAPNSASFWSSLNQALQRQNKPEEAIVALRKAVELNPNSDWAHVNLGNVLRTQKKLDEAIDSYKRAIELGPKNANSCYALGIALREQQKLDEAVIVFRRVIELDPKHGAAHGHLGSILAIQRKVNEGVALIRKAIELNPKLAGSHTELAWYLATAADPKLRDPQAAVAHAGKAVQLEPKNGNSRSKLGVALLRAGDFTAAVEQFEQAEQIWLAWEVWQKGDLRHRFFLAMAYWQLGEQDKARQAFEQGVQWMDTEQPNNDEQRRFRAEAAELLGIAEPAVAKAQ